MSTPDALIPFRYRHIIVGWLAGALLLAALQCRAGLTNVSVVNITASGFSLVWTGTASGVPSVSVFSDALGSSNLTGVVGVELDPVHTADPLAANAYERRQSQATLRQKARARGLFHARVTGCQPGVTYYYLIRTLNPGGQGDSVWPESGPLPAVTTALENSFVVRSQQLLFNLPGLDPAGSILLLSNTNTASRLAAIAGDGVSSNQVFFSLGDLIAASGETNYWPIGVQEFTASVLSASSNVVTQTYSLGFTTDFLVGQADSVDLGDYLVLKIGSTNVRAGDVATLPIALNASSVSQLSFVVEFPSNRFSSFSIQSASPSSFGASVTPVAANAIRIELSAVAGQTLQGNRQVAMLHCVSRSDQPSAFVTVLPRSVQGRNFNGAPVGNVAAQAGRIVLVGEEPLLEAFWSARGERSLMLYGKPWASYAIETATSPSRPAWTFLLRAPMTNLVQEFRSLDTNQMVVFYRALEFSANPPLLEAGLSGRSRELLLFGEAGARYTLQTATNLSGVVRWNPRLALSLTNSFQRLTNLGSAEPTVFYRLERN